MANAATRGSGCSSCYKRRMHSAREKEYIFALELPWQPCDWCAVFPLPCGARESKDAAAVCAVDGTWSTAVIVAEQRRDLSARRIPCGILPRTCASENSSATAHARAHTHTGRQHLFLLFVTHWVFGSIGANCCSCPPDGVQVFPPKSAARGERHEFQMVPDVCRAQLFPALEVFTLEIRKSSRGRFSEKSYSKRRGCAINTSWWEQSLIKTTNIHTALTVKHIVAFDSFCVKKKHNLSMNVTRSYNVFFLVHSLTLTRTGRCRML